VREGRLLYVYTLESVETVEGNNRVSTGKKQTLKSAQSFKKSVHQFLNLENVSVRHLKSQNAITASKLH